MSLQGHLLSGPRDGGDCYGQVSPGGPAVSSSCGDLWSTSIPEPTKQAPAGARQVADISDIGRAGPPVLPGGTVTRFVRPSTVYIETVAQT